MKHQPQDTLPGALRLAAKHLKNLIVLNVLCLLHALLIVTAGRSLSALVRVLMRIVNGEQLSPVRAFREEFKKKDSAKACWIFLLALAVAGLAVWLCWKSTLRMLLLAALLATFGSGVIVYYLPMVCMIDIPPLVALQNAFALSLVLAKRTIPSFIFTVIWCGVCALIPPYTTVLAVLCGLSMPVFVCGAIGWPGVKELVLERPDAPASGDQYYMPPQTIDDIYVPQDWKEDTRYIPPNGGVKPRETAETENNEA